MTSDRWLLTAFGTLVTLVVLGIIWLLWPTPAQAQENWPWAEFSKQTAKQAKRQYKRRRRPQVRSYRRRAKRHHKRRREPGCQPSLSITGKQFASLSGAKARADKAWQGAARFRHGERFMDLRFARGVKYQCVHSSVENIANRATEAVGINSQLKRCQITAQPCVAPMVDAMK